MAAKAGRLQIQLELEVQQLRRDLAAVNDQLKRSANQWQNTLAEFKRGFLSAFTAGAAVAAVGAVTSAVTNMLDEMGRIQDESAKIRDTAENFQRLEFAATQSGVAMEDVVSATGKLQKQLGEIDQGGGKGAAAALERLNIQLEDLRALSPAQAFMKVGGALGEVGDASEQAAIGAALFGKGWQSMLPLIQSGEEGMRAMADAARVMSNEAVAAGDQFGDSMAAMQSAATQLLSEGLAPLLPILNNVASYLLTTGTEAKDAGGGFNIFAEALKHAIVLVADVVAGFRLIGAVITNMGETIGIVAAAAVEGFGLIGQAAQDALDPSKLMSGEALDNMKRNAQEMTKNLTRELALSRAEFLKTSGAAIDSLSNITYAVQQTKAAATAPAPTGATGGEEAAAEAARAAAAREEAAKREKANREALTASIKAQADAMRDLQNEVDKEDAKRKEVAKLEMDLLALQKQLGGATEEQVRQWRLSAEGADVYARAISDTTAKIDATADAVAKQKQQQDDLKESTIELVASQMRLGGASEQAVRAYEDMARGLDDVDKKIRSNREERDKNAAQMEEDRQKAQQWTDAIGYGLADVFTAMTEGSEQAEEALKRLIAQMLAAILTAKILQAFGLTNAGATATAAQGSAWTHGLRAFAQGGVVNAPTAFGFAGGVGVMGERGPEAIMPLRRDATGKLGVSGGTNVQIFNYAGADISVQRDQERLRIIVDQVRQTIAGDIARGGNPVASAIERAYTVRR